MILLSIFKGHILFIQKIGHILERQGGMDKKRHFLVNLGQFNLGTLLNDMQT